MQIGVSMASGQPGSKRRSIEATARRRLTDRNRFTTEEVDQRLASQRPWEDRKLAADLVIFNDRTIEEFATRVRSEFHTLHQLWIDGALMPSRYEQWWREREADGVPDGAA